MKKDNLIKNYIHFHIDNINNYNKLLKNKFNHINKYFNILITYSNGKLKKKIKNINFLFCTNNYKLKLIKYLKEKYISSNLFLVYNVNINFDNKLIDNINKKLILLNNLSYNQFLKTNDFNIINLNKKIFSFDYKLPTSIVKYKKNLLINYHIFDRDNFNLYNLGYLIESFFEKNYYCDIFLTFILPKTNNDKIIINDLKNKYGLYNCNIFVNYRINSGVDVKSIFTTLDYCKNNSLEYDWFYHTHTKSIRHVAIDNFLFYNYFDLCLKLVNYLYSKNNISIIGSGYNLILNIVDYEKGKTLANIINYLKEIEFNKKYTITNYINSIFFGGNIWIANYNYLMDIINNINFNKLLKTMSNPNSDIDYYWIDYLLNKNKSKINKDLISKAFKNNYLPSGNPYSIQSLVNKTWRDNSVPNILERAIPFILSLYGDVHTYCLQESNFNFKFIKNKYKQEFNHFDDFNLKNHFFNNSFYEFRNINNMIFDGFYKIKIDYPINEYINNISNTISKKINIDDIIKDFNNFKYLNINFNGEKNVIHTHNGNNSLLFNYIDSYEKMINKIFLKQVNSKKIILDDSKLIKNISNIKINYKLNYNVFSNSLKKINLNNCGDIIHDLIFSSEEKNNINISDSNKDQIIFNLNYIKYLLRNNIKIKNLIKIKNKLIDKNSKEKYKIINENLNQLKEHLYLIYLNFFDLERFLKYNKDYNYSKINLNFIKEIVNNNYGIGIKITKDKFNNYIKNLDINDDLKDILDTIINIMYDLDNDEINIPETLPILNFNYLFNKNNFRHLNLHFKNKFKQKKIYNLLKFKEIIT